MVFQDDEETGDEVAHQVLRSEADRQAADAHAGEDGHDVKAELPNRNQDCHAHDHGGADHAQQAAQGVGALASFGDLCQRAFARNGDHRKTGDQQVQDSNQRKSAPENKQDAQARSRQPRGHLFPSQLRNAANAQPAQDDQQRGDASDNFDRVADKAGQLLGPALNLFDVLLVFLLHAVGQAADEARGEPQPDPHQHQHAHHGE